MIIDVCTYHWRGTSPWYSLRGGKPGGICGAGPTGTERVAQDPADLSVLLGYTSNHLNVHVPYEAIAARVSKEPRLAAGFVGIDPLDDRASETLSSALELGASGVVVSPADQDCRPTHESFMRLMSECAERGIAVMVSNPGLRCASSRLEFAAPALLDEAAGAFPSLTMVIGELRVHPDEALLMAARHENVYIETSTLVDNPSALQRVLLSAHHTGVTEKFLFGSGAPFVDAADAVQRIFSINRLGIEPDQGVPRERLRAIVERDALGVLGIEDAPRSAHAPVTPVEPVALPTRAHAS